MRRLIALCAVVIGVGITVAPGVASAHAVLDSSSPAASSVLAESPREITLNFNEDVESSLSEIRLFDSARKEIRIGRAQRQNFDPSVVISEVPVLKNGTYVVVWHVVSADGHPVDGAFAFEVGTTSSGTADELLRRVVTSVNAGSPLGGPLAVARFLGFLATMVLVGAVVFSWSQSVPPWMALGRLLRLSTVVLVAGSLGVLLLQGPYASGRSWGAIVDTRLIGDVLSTRIGVASLARLAVAVVWGLLALMFAHKGGSLWRNVAVLASFTTVASWSVSGHPSAATHAAIYVAVDVVHLVAVSSWVGGLVALWWVRSGADSTLVVRVSRIATVSMPVAFVTGVVQGLHIAGGVGSITDTTYGRLLVAKTVLVVAIVVVAARARRHAMRADALAVLKVVRSELVIMALVVAATAILVGTSPVGSTASPSSFNATLVQSSVVADLALEPARTGTSQVHVTLTPPGGTLTPVTAVTVQLSLPSRAIPAIPVEMLELGPNHWSGVVTIPFAGEWTFEARVTTRDRKILLYTATATVS